MKIVIEETNHNEAMVTQMYYDEELYIGDESKALKMSENDIPKEPAGLEMGKGYQLFYDKTSKKLFYKVIDVNLTIEQQLIQSREEVKSVRENTDNAIIEMTQLIMMMGGMSDV